jgi:hypothetical protein
MPVRCSGGRKPDSSTVPDERTESVIWTSSSSSGCRKRQSPGQAVDQVGGGKGDRRVGGTAGVDKYSTVSGQKETVLGEGNSLKNKGDLTCMSKLYPARE